MQTHANDSETEHIQFVSDSSAFTYMYFVKVHKNGTWVKCSRYEKCVFFLF